MISRTREQWQQHIIAVIKTIDEHSQEYIQSGNQFHKDQHDYLVEYVHRIKTYIKHCEARESLPSEATLDTEATTNGS